MMKDKIPRIIDMIFNKGHIRIRSPFYIEKRMAEQSAPMTGRVRCVLTDVNTGKEEVHEVNNLIVTVCKNMVAARLAGEGNDCNITYGAVGTNNTAPAASDTTLGTELARKAVSLVSRSGNVVTCTTFFSTTEANGAIKEVGMFGQAASATPDSGTMINRTLISFTKSSSQTLSIQGTFTIN